MSFHSKLQRTIELLEVELDNKDSQLANAKEAKLDAERRMQQFTSENESLQQQIDALQALEVTETQPLRGSFQQCKDDNATMASLDALLKSNTALQAQVDGLNDKLEKSRPGPD